MAEQNPIKYSDLISPDDSIERLIKQLENLQSTYEGMASSIQQRAAAVAASLRTVSGATSQGQQATKKASEDADKLAKAYRDLAFAESENAKKLAELKLAQKEANDLNKLTIKLNQSAEGSYNALSAQYSINKIYLNNMTKEERRLWYDYLRTHPVRFNRQKVLGKYIADFYSAAAHLVIELDGGGHFSEESAKYDAERTAFLESYGLKVIRIPNNEVNNNFRGVCEYIDLVIEQSLSQLR